MSPLLRLCDFVQELGAFYSLYSLYRNVCLQTLAQVKREKSARAHFSS
jgi:hypothetical protein